MSAEQLPFDLGFRHAYAREDFWVSHSNREAVSLLDQWPQWPSHAVLLLGGKSSGKTHLLQVWKKESGAEEYPVGEITTFSPADISRTHVAVDDAQLALGNAESERALLHIYNAVKDAGKTMVLCFEKPVREYTFVLPDLRSRLMSAPMALIGPPDEELMAVVLSKMFSDRQVFVPQEVVQFLVPRVERSFTALGEVVEKIDRRAMADKKSVTIPLVKDVLGV